MCNSSAPTPSAWRPDPEPFREAVDQALVRRSRTSLCSRQEASSIRGLPDVRDIADAIIAKDPSAWIVIDRVQEVAEPVSEPLRRLGVSSLREAIGEPDRVVGSGEVEFATTSTPRRI